MPISSSSNILKNLNLNIINTSITNYIQFVNKTINYISVFFCWFFCRPCDRNLRDVELISCRLRRVEPLCRLPGSALQQLALCGFYEDLEKGVTCKCEKYKLFRTLI